MLSALHGLAGCCSTLTLESAGSLMSASGFFCILHIHGGD